MRRAPVEIAPLRAGVLRWYRRHRRDLPWRRSRDPWAIWVAEVMLQQTQVATVVPYYRRFLQRFPDAASLARASEEEVLGLWSGLGYYRRARALRDGARAVMDHHGGRIPRDARELAGLPGIGRYTAGAIASIAFDLAEPVLDGNVARVLSRLHGLDGRDRPRLWELAAALVQGASPGDLNQALMELGALICTPRSPSCEACPLRGPCRAKASHDPESFPARRPAAPTRRVRVAVAWIERRGRILLEHPRRGDPLRGLWDLPALELAPAASAATALGGFLGARHGLEVRVGPPLARSAHAILERRLSLELYPCRVRRGRVARRDDLRWADPGSLEGIATSGATLKLARTVQQRLHSGDGATA